MPPKITLEEADESKKLRINFQPSCSDWKCYMFGNKPDGSGMIYIPAEGQVPNRFVRFMMKVCFDCLWVKEEN